MSCNYYIKARTTCACCARPYENVMIGKSAWGWKFSFRTYEQDSTEVRHGCLPHPVNSYSEWISALKDADIIDENNNPISLDELVDLIESKQGHESHSALYPRYSFTDEQGYEMASEPFE